MQYVLDCCIQSRLFGISPTFPVIQVRTCLLRIWIHFGHFYKCIGIIGFDSSILKQHVVDRTTISHLVITLSRYAPNHQNRMLHPASSPHKPHERASNRVACEGPSRPEFEASSPTPRSHLHFRLWLVSHCLLPMWYKLGGAALAFQGMPTWGY